MSVSLKFEGLDVLYAELRKLPADLAAEGGHIVEGFGNRAALQIRAEYDQHRDTGDLLEGVDVVHEPTGYGARAIVKSQAKHAHLFEDGSQMRKNSYGANRGAMPAANVFVPIMVRIRFAMYEDLAALVRRAGLEVRRG